MRCLGIERVLAYTLFEGERTLKTLRQAQCPLFIEKGH